MKNVLNNQVSNFRELIQAPRANEELFENLSVTVGQVGFSFISQRINKDDRLLSMIFTCKNQEIFIALDVIFGHKHNRHPIFQSEPYRKRTAENFLGFIKDTLHIEPAAAAAAAQPPAAKENVVTRCMHPRYFVLTDHQAGIANLQIARGASAMVLGAAGTGKTLCAIHWLNMTENDAPAAYFTVEQTLADTIRKNFADRPTIRVFDLASLLTKLREVLPEIVVPRLPAATFDTFKVWHTGQLLGHAGQQKAGRFHPRDLISETLYAEFTHIIMQPSANSALADARTTRPHLTQEEYRQLGRDQSYIDTAHREAVYHFFVEYLKTFSSSSSSATHYEPHHFYHELWQQLVVLSERQADKLHDLFGARLVIDEMQNLHPWLLRCLLTILSPTAILLLTGDPSQVIVGQRRHTVAPTQAALGLYNRPYEMWSLQDNFRSAPAIAAMSRVLFCTESQWWGAAEKTGAFFNTETQGATGGVLTITQDSDAAFFNKVKESIAYLVVIPDTQWQLLLSNAVEKTAFIARYGVNFLPVSQIGGLEYEQVVFLAFDRTYQTAFAELSRFADQRGFQDIERTTRNKDEQSKPSPASRGAFRMLALAISRAKMAFHFIHEEGASAPTFVRKLFDRVQSLAESTSSIAHIKTTSLARLKNALSLANANNVAQAAMAETTLYSVEVWTTAQNVELVKAILTAKRTSLAGQIQAAQHILNTEGYNAVFLADQTIDQKKEFIDKVLTAHPEKPAGTEVIAAATPATVHTVQRQKKTPVPPASAALPSPPQASPPSAAAAAAQSTPARATAAAPARAAAAAAGVKPPRPKTDTPKQLEHSLLKTWDEFCQKETFHPFETLYRKEYVENAELSLKILTTLFIVYCLLEKDSTIQVLSSWMEASGKKKLCIGPKARIEDAIHLTDSKTPVGTQVQKLIELYLDCKCEKTNKDGYDTFFIWVKAAILFGFSSYEFIIPRALTSLKSKLSFGLVDVKKETPLAKWDFEDLVNLAVSNVEKAKTILCQCYCDKNFWAALLTVFSKDYHNEKSLAFFFKLSSGKTQFLEHSPTVLLTFSQCPDKTTFLNTVTALFNLLKLDSHTPVAAKTSWHETLCLIIKSLFDKHHSIFFEGATSAHNQSIIKTLIELSKQKKNQAPSPLMEALVSILVKKNALGWTNFHIMALHVQAALEQLIELSKDEPALLQAIIAALSIQDNKEEWTGFQMMARNAPAALQQLMVLSKDRPKLLQAISAALGIENLNGWTGFHMVARHAPVATQELIGLSKDRTELLQAIIAALTIQEKNERWTGFQMMARNAPAALQQLMVLSKDRPELLPELLEAISAALGIENLNGWTGFHMVVQYAPAAMQELIGLTKDSPALLQAIIAALRIQDNKLEWTGFQIMAQNAPAALQQLMALSKDRPALLQAISAALGIKNRKNWTGFHMVANHAPTAMQELIGLSKDSKDSPALLEAIIAALGIQEKEKEWTGFQMMAQNAPAALQQLMVLSKDRPKLLQAISAALGIKNDKDWTGFHMVARHAPAAMQELIVLSKDEPALLQAIIAALTIPNNENWTGFHMVARYAPTAMQELIGLSKDRRELLQVIIAALTIPNNENCMGFHMVARHAPAAMQELIVLSKDNSDLLTPIIAALVIQEKEEKWTGFQIMAQHAPAALQQLIALSKDRRELLQAIIAALTIPNNENWTGFHMVAHHAPTAMQELIVLSKDNSDLLTPIIAALTIPNKNSWTGFHMVVRHAPTATRELIGLSKDNSDLLTAIIAALTIKHSEGWTGLQIMPVTAPAALEQLIALAKDRPALLQAIIAALTIKNNQGWPGFPIIAVNARAAAQELMGLSENNSALLTAISAALTIKNNEKWTSFGMMGCYVSQAFQALVTELILFSDRSILLKIMYNGLSTKETIFEIAPLILTDRANHIGLLLLLLIVLRKYNIHEAMNWLFLPVVRTSTLIDSRFNPTIFDFLVIHFPALRRTLFGFLTDNITLFQDSVLPKPLSATAAAEIAAESSHQYAGRMFSLWLEPKRMLQLAPPPTCASYYKQSRFFISLGRVWARAKNSSLTS